MSNIVIGSTAAIEQAKSFAWSPKDGPRATRTWRGGKAAIDTQAAVMVGLRWSIEKRQVIGSDLWELTATASVADGQPELTGAEIVDTWELLPKETTKDILAGDVAAVNALPAEHVAALRKIKAENLRDDEIPAWTGSPSNALAILALLRAGVESVEIEQPTLQHTWTVPYGMSLTYSYANIGRIYSTATLLSAEALPNDIANGVLSWTSQFNNPTRSDGVTVVWGWRKKAPQLRNSVNNRSEIVQSWEFGLWSTLLYGSAL